MSLKSTRNVCLQLSRIPWQEAPLKEQECHNIVVTTKTLEGIMPVESNMDAKQMGTALSTRWELQSQLL